MKNILILPTKDIVEELSFAISNIAPDELHCLIVDDLITYLVTQYEETGVSWAREIAEHNNDLFYITDEKDREMVIEASVVFLNKYDKIIRNVFGGDHAEKGINYFYEPMSSCDIVLSKIVSNPI